MGRMGLGSSAAGVRGLIDSALSATGVRDLID